MNISRCCQGHAPQSAVVPRRPRQPWRGVLSRALPISDGRADSAGDANRSVPDGGPHSAEQAGAARQKPAAPWPRVISESRDNSYESRSEPDMFSWSDEELPPAEAAKSREAFLLRLATLGFGGVLVGERLTGRGVVQALGHPTGIPLAEMDIFLGLLAGALLVGGLVPTNIVYESVNEEMPGIFDDIPALVGRASCVLLAVTIIAEVMTGKGALALLNLETGTEYVSEIEGGLIFVVLLLVTSTSTRRQD